MGLAVEPTAGSTPPERPRVALVLLSGTDDRLGAATMLIAGAAATGRHVDVLLLSWALEAFRRDSMTKDHGVSAEAGPEGAAILVRWQEQNPVHWSDTLRQVARLGPVRIAAGSVSMEVLGLTLEDLDPIVQEVLGVESFWERAGGAEILFV